MGDREKYWEKQKEINYMNKDNVNPIIQMTIDDKKSMVGMKHPKVIYAECLKGSLFWNQWGKDEDLSVEDMSVIICRAKGCELTYCSATMHDPYERPFEDCSSQYKDFTQCLSQEQQRFIHAPEGRTKQEQVAFMLEKQKQDRLTKMLNSEILVQNEPIKMSNKNKIEMTNQNKI